MKISTSYAQFGKSQTLSKQELLLSTCKNNARSLNVIRSLLAVCFLALSHIFQSVIETGSWNHMDSKLF